MSARKPWVRATVTIAVFISLLATVAIISQTAPPVAPEVTLCGLPVDGLTRAEVEALVAEVAGRMDRLPRDATRDPKTWRIRLESDGLEVERPATVQRVLIAPPGAALLPTVTVVKPDVTAKMLLPTIQHAGKFETVILDRSPARVHNIRVAVGCIDGWVLEPGAAFSFNAATDQPGVKYRKAPVIQGDRMVLEAGGGLCQVSTTLYNAALAAGLEILERHRHTPRVDYAPPGRDATVYDDKDLRLKNKGPHPVMIRARVHGYRVKVRILEYRPVEAGDI